MVIISESSVLDLNSLLFFIYKQLKIVNLKQHFKAKLLSSTLELYITNVLKMSQKAI